jgi:hypothetical protein
MDRATNKQVFAATHCLELKHREYEYSAVRDREGDFQFLRLATANILEIGWTLGKH